MECRQVMIDRGDEQIPRTCPVHGIHGCTPPNEMMFPHDYWEILEARIRRLAVNDVATARLLQTIARMSTDNDSAVKILVLFAGSPTATDVCKKIVQEDK